MSPLQLDARFTFETFVVGTANRLACAAAKRVAEAPGTTYNPLFIYSASGLGKTHLVTAVGHLAQRIHPDRAVEYDTLEHFMDAIMEAIEAGETDAYRARLSDTGMLILDDVQFLAGRHRTQDELLRAWDALMARGGQVVLASDRPPHEIDGLDDRLLSRFSGGLIVDIGVPDYETRVAIARRKADERGQSLGLGVAEALARVSFSNVRELQGALNRVFALQELEDRRITPDEVLTLIGGSMGAQPAARRTQDEFGAFLADISETVEEVVARSPGQQQLGDAILRWESDGYNTRRLETALQEHLAVPEVESLIRGYEADVERLREVALEMGALDPTAAELGRHDLLRDPDRVEEAVDLLGDVRERTQPLPEPPQGPELEALDLPADLLACRAAAAIAERPASLYNPFFVHGDAAGTRALLGAMARRLAGHDPDGAVAYVAASTFAGELIRALERNRVEAWRQRYRRARVLVVEQVDRLAETERAQEELFHLFDALVRSGAQLAFSAARPPAELDGMEARLRTRLGSGLVAEVPAAGGVESHGTVPSRVLVPDAAPSDDLTGPDAWFFSREKVAWDWPYLRDILQQELD